MGFIKYWIEPNTFEETEYGWVNKNLHLLRYENLQESYDIFRKSIGLEPFRLLRRNVNVKKKKKTPKYTDKMIEDINSVFSSDIKNFVTIMNHFYKEEFHENN